MDPLDIPRHASEVQQEAIKQMERELAASREREERAAVSARISEKDRGELARLRQEKKDRHRKAEHKRRAAQSRKGKKSGYMKRKKKNTKK
jgi:hypothetical protein